MASRWEEDEHDDEDWEHGAWEDDEELEFLPCPECGKQVYEEAEQCPYCGSYIIDANRQTLSDIFYWTAIVLIVLFVLGYISYAL